MERGRADDRLEDGDPVYFLVGGDRVGPLAIDRRRKPFELGRERIEPPVLDDFGFGYGVATGGWSLGHPREPELDVLVRELAATLFAVHPKPIRDRPDPRAEQVR